VSGSQLLRDLQRTLEVFATPDTWCQGEYAETESELGTFVKAMPEDSSACRWCLTGAVYVSTGTRITSTLSSERERLLACFEALHAQMPPPAPNEKGWVHPETRLVWWNDREGRTVNEVRDLIVRAVRKEERSVAAE
jgi:hypothetical protein